MSKKVLIIGFYNEKALGAKYLANKLITEGYEVDLLFFKRFNSVNPGKATTKELDLLEEVLNTSKPSYVCMSVMASLYLETVYLVNERIREKFSMPIIWGGVYPTLFPERSLQYADYVIRGEGEETLTELLDKLENGIDIHDVMNLSYEDDNGKMINNEIRPLVQNIDQFGYPRINGTKTFFIHNNTVSVNDPQADGYTYELSASRGCPFTCSYCSSINLKRLYFKKGRYIRFRSVDSVMAELIEAKQKIKNLKTIHFWDEIFSDDENWITQFKERYKKEIGLPFNIWGHPLKINENVVKNLVEAGLHQIVVGIQSGSVRVRKDIFNRPESQEEIIEASRVLARCKVPIVIYDFMLQHPFETLDDLKETYNLCTKLQKPFRLQLHGLNFLPGTDIVDMAIEEGHLSKEELEKIMYSSIQEQYDMYWGPAAMNIMTENNTWVALTFLTQFSKIRFIVKRLKSRFEKGKGEKRIIIFYKIMKKVARLFDILHKIILRLK